MVERLSAAFVLALVSLLFLAGCSTYRTVALDRVTLGDEVRVHTLDGQQHEFEVTFVGDKALGGGGVSVPVDQIDTVEIHSNSAARAIFVGLFSIKETRLYILCGLIFVIIVLAA